jgi:poly(3-hydroxybutyrate) depolymerase
MNMDNHVNKHFKFFNDLIKGDGDSAEAHRQFYNEYLAVMDMPAKYYLETIRKVFLQFKLPTGTMEYRGNRIDMSAITKTALFTVEGEQDDITGKGQTSVALSLCNKLAKNKKQHYEQKEVGHYGTFNGRRFRETVAPKVKEFMKQHA